MVVDVLHIGPHLILFGVRQEQLVLQLFDAIVQFLNRDEIAVDEVVQQPVRQEGHTVPGQVGGRIPQGHDGINVEGVGVHGHQGATGDEGRDRVRGHQ